MAVGRQTKKQFRGKENLPLFSGWRCLTVSPVFDWSSPVLSKKKKKSFVFSFTQSINKQCIKPTKQHQDAKIQFTMLYNRDPTVRASSSYHSSNHAYITYNKRELYTVLVITHLYSFTNWYFSCSWYTNINTSVTKDAKMHQNKKSFITTHVHKKNGHV